MSSVIIDFWKANPSFWITMMSKQEEVDTLLSEKFLQYDWRYENILGQIIYLDQFTRHFQRAGHITEKDVTDCRRKAIEIIYTNLDCMCIMDQVEIVFALMPFKHMRQYGFIFSYLHTSWLSDKKILDFPFLQKFYIDTYKKAFTFDIVKSGILTQHPRIPYNPDDICDFYPEIYTREGWNLDGAMGENLLDLLDDLPPHVCVSLSGGVDSMVMVSLLKYKGIDVYAVHIIYDNRKESDDEYHFLSEFCLKIGVPLFVYRIPCIRRGEIDRQFYEDMTRDLRFSVYRAVEEIIGLDISILMGHIKDDIIENVWTNIAHCHHIDNLKKMERDEVQLRVHIIRPFLSAEKSDIYRVSETLGIPYFKNTTPGWSNRGKFRTQFHQATVAQFGTSIDEKILTFAETIQKQASLLHTLLYQPIYDSFEDNTLDITTAVKASLDTNGWLTIFEHICYTRLHIPRPSIKCVGDFVGRLNKPCKRMHINMSKHLKVIIVRFRDDRVMMGCIRD